MAGIRDYLVTFVDVDVPTVTITVKVAVGDTQTEPTDEEEATQSALRVLRRGLFNIDTARLTCIHVEEETT